MSTLRATPNLIILVSFFLLAILLFGNLPHTESKVRQSVEQPIPAVQLERVTAEPIATAQIVSTSVKEIVVGVAAAVDVLASSGGIQAGHN